MTSKIATEIAATVLTTACAAACAAIPAAQVAPSTIKPAELQLEAKWDKVFAQSSKVNHSKITFVNRYGITLAADLYVPKNAQGKLPAIAVSGPFGAVKEQSSGLYAQTLAERGYLTIAFDPSFTGESGGYPRYVASGDINTEDFSAAVDYLSTREDVNPDKIGILGICGWGGMAINAAAADVRIKATVAATMYDMSRVTANGYFDSLDAEGRYKDRVRRCLDSISAQLARDNKTFRYSDVEDNPDYAVGSKYFEYALNWLSGAELSLICDCVTQPRLPLEENAINPAFKLYLLDTGLLLSMYDDSILYDVLSGGVDVNKGALSENLVACMLHSQGRRLYYYQISEKGKERMELDFVTIIGGKATAIEVKSGKKRDTKSLNKAMEKFGIDGIMFETRNIFVDDKGVRHYPLFAASFMDCIDVKPELTVDLPDADSINERFGDRDSDRYRRPRRDILSTLPRTTLPQKARPMRITSPLIPR